jgi:zinc transport system substrate-binding protein
MQKNRSWLWRLSLLLCVMLCAAGMTGCSSTNGTDTAKYSIVCTTFPQYDWLREIIGENADSFSLMLLLDKGGDLHSYQPTAESIARISSADMFVYVGGESDTWVEDALKGAVNKDMRVVNLMDLLGGMVKEEELVEGMQCYEEAEHEETEYDEHVWLSLKNAAYLTGALSETLQELDAEHAQEYAANAAAYIESLNALDREYADAVKQSEKKTILFGDRFPFRYLTEDYGIHYYAAFAGCSTETDASFETVTFLSGKVDELGLHTILTIEGSDQKIAEIIRENTHGKNQQIQTVNSLQSVTAKEIQDGFTYLEAMRENYEVLKNALN